MAASSETAPNTSSDAIFAQSSAVNDLPASEDALGFKVYVEAVADFLLDPATHPPFTISIEGPWGSGKSSFMRQLKLTIEDRSRDSDCVGFNAWKYDKQEELWAAFALAVARCLRKSSSIPRQFLGSMRLYAYRIKGIANFLQLMVKLLTWTLLVLAFGAAIYWSAKIRESNGELFVRNNVRNYLTDLAEKEGSAAGRSNSLSQPIETLAVNVIAASPWWTGAILIIGLLLKLPESSRKNLFELKLEKYIDKPDYAGKAAFVDTFSEDFAKLVKAYHPRKDGKIFVFIDDLDRCEAPKAADLMQAINLMIGDGSPLLFIIGFDRAKVASSIAYKYREIVPYLSRRTNEGLASSPEEGISHARVFGDEFLQKFIQLSFRIPGTIGDDKQAQWFINSMIDRIGRSNTRASWSQRLSQWFQRKSADTPSELTRQTTEQSNREPYRIEPGPESDRIRKVLFAVREILGFNPRRIKTFLNVYRLALSLASRHGLLDKDPGSKLSEVTPEQLGKFIALTTSYPEILESALKDPEFFRNLEFFMLHRIALTGHSEEETEYWLAKPGVRNLMGFGQGFTDSPDQISGSWNAYSLRDFPVSKFTRILPEVPARKSTAAPAENDRQEVSSKSPEPHVSSFVAEQTSEYGEKPANVKMSPKSPIPQGAKVPAESASEIYSVPAESEGVE